MMQTVLTLPDVYGVGLVGWMSCHRSITSRKILFGVAFVSFRAGPSMPDSQSGGKS